jgi:type I restriction enzyme S subunit
MGHGIVADLWTTRYDEMRGIVMALPSYEEQRAIAAFLADKCAKIDEAVKIKEDQITLLIERRKIIIQDAVTYGLDPSAPMKEISASWIGRVPTHWTVGPGRICIYENKLKNIGMKENTVLSLSYGRVIVKDEEKMTGLVPESYETYQIIQPGDIVIRGTDLQNDITSLRTGLAKNKGIITSAYICLRPKKNADASFLHYLLHSYDVKKVFYGLGSGLRQNLSYEDFKYLLLPLPCIKEQREIVNFLDQYCTKLDSGMDLKKRQIAALKEYKTSLINAAVTGKIKVV